VTWFFAIVVVAVLGAVAVVASGRGGSMSETYDDRPDALVPADRPLTAQDLREVRLSTGFRGYRMSEVDALIDRLAAEMAQARDPATNGSPAASQNGTTNGATNGARNGSPNGSTTGNTTGSTTGSTTGNVPGSTGADAGEATS
jgi:DivIVA domain-containing protein